MAPGERALASSEGTEPVKRSGTSRPRYRYLVTIKRNAIEYTPIPYLKAQYERIVKAIPNAEWSDQVSYELDTLYRMHLHTIVVSTKPIYYKRLVRTGWHIHFAPFLEKDYGKVYSYIMKHKQTIYHLEEEDLCSQLQYGVVDFISDK